ncbi:hypothetical protein [Streptomyces uncialis]|uniref:hypothetical protein n=1 Tax=Streptomyces uncialis TaxID=1048205 RepID=UPI002E3807CF|nr:hypothetical protein [Streptomyces uncialis]
MLRFSAFAAVRSPTSAGSPKSTENGTDSSRPRVIAELPRLEQALLPERHVGDPVPGYGASGTPKSANSPHMVKEVQAVSQ